MSGRGRDRCLAIGICATRCEGRTEHDERTGPEGPVVTGLFGG
jgi:hypothetical protein